MSLAFGASAQVSPNVNWSGFYASFGVTLNRHQADVTTTAYGSLSGVTLKGTPQVSVGVNHDFGQYVLGSEFEYIVGNFRIAGTTTDGASVDSSLDNLLSARMKAGVEYKRLLLYATAGVAGGKSSLSTTYTDGKSGDSSSGARRGYVFGYTAGAGMEYAISNDLSLKVEGTWTKLSPLTVDASGTSSPYSATSQIQRYAITTGVGLRFH